MTARPSSRRALLSLAFALLLAAPLAGCANRSPVLAQVGEGEITADEFMDVARANQAQYPGSPDSAKSALLEDMLKRELLVAAGRARGLVPAAELARTLEQAKEQLAFRALVETVVPRDIPVTDAEVEELHRRRAEEAHVRIVFTPDRPASEAALAEIRRGAEFGATADRFNTTGMTPPGGDLQFKTAGDLMPTLDSLVTHAPVGEVVGPVESPGDGFFLIQVLERRPRTAEPLDQVKEALRNGIRTNKQRTLANRWQKQLLAQYHVRLEAGAGQVVFARYNAPKDTVVMNGIRVPVPAQPTAEESARVLVHYDGEGGKPAAYTLGDAVADLRDDSQVRPNFTMVPMIEQWLHNAVLQKVARIEVARRHLADDPKVQRQAQAQVDNVILQAAYESLVAGSAGITAADVRAAYDRHAAQLVDPSGKPMPFETLQPNILQALQAEAMEMGRERRLGQVTDSLRTALKPQLHPERLKRIPWPVPTETKTGA